MYELLLLLHILTVVVAFAGTWTNPRFAAYGAKGDETTRAGIAGVMVATTTQMHLPALVLAGLSGIGLISVGDGFEFSQTWISLAFLLWFALLGVMWFLLRPAQVLAATGDAEAGKKVAMFTGIIHLLFLLMLIDMIWKPGF